jgi:hypothetical protein
MARKNQSSHTTEVFINNNHTGYTEQEHLLEHVHFLEERTTELEEKVNFFQTIFHDLLDDEDDDEDEDTEDEVGEDEYEDEEDLFKNGLCGHTCCCVWSRVVS